MGRRSYSEAEVADWRLRIGRAAVSIFERHGAEGVTMRSIARELGCSATLPYTYFASKDEIFAFVSAEGFRRLTARFEAGMAGAVDPRAELDAIASSYLEFAMEEPDLYRAMFSLRQGDLAQHPDVRQGRQAAFGCAVDAATRAAAEGTIDTDPLALAHLFWISLHGLASLELAGQLDRGMTFEKLVGPLAQQYAGGRAQRVKETTA